MKQQTCEDCVNFQQHYIRLEGERYTAACCGHCIYPRLKKRDQFTKACEHFASRNEPVENVEE